MFCRVRQVAVPAANCLIAESALFVVYTTRKCDNLQLNTAHSKQNIRLKYNLTKYVYKEISIEQGI